MGGACSSYGGKERFIQNFGGETWVERDHLEHVGIDGMIILKLILEK
jgi:hypothetical protein